MMPEGWQLKKFVCVARIANGQVSPTEAPYVDYYHIGPENVDGETGCIQGIQTARELNLISGKYLFDKDAVVYSKIRPNLNKVCLPDFTGICSADMYPLWALEGTHRLYLYQYMRSEYFLKQAIKVSMRTGLPKINRDDLNQLSVLLPPLPEQRRIADILDTWDRAIRLTEQRIAAQQQRKRALMQHLLTGRRRFREFAGSEWNYLKLEEFLIPEQRKVPKPSTTYPAIGVRSHGKGTFQKDDVDPEDVSMDTLYRVRHNDLIVSITFAWEGAIALVRETDDGCLVSHRFPTYVFDAQKVIPEFFRYIILTKWFVFQLGLISPGGAGRNRVLSKNDFLKLKVLLPSLEEQQRIAAVLQAADSEMALLAARRAALQRQKHGLMQQLLTGRVRVPLPETHTKGADDGSNPSLP
jgi:type I restriction enzyme S subunit